MPVRAHAYSPRLLAVVLLAPGIVVMVVHLFDDRRAQDLRQAGTDPVTTGEGVLAGQGAWLRDSRRQDHRPSRERTARRQFRPTRLPPSGSVPPSCDRVRVNRNAHRSTPDPRRL